ncbi:MULTISPECIES: hypothetical protein [Streptomyces]|uniref:Uncharacterized protein n=2 Tax=Streptomyces nigrescens TaxID=1920 RepID=A0A640TKZ1_STRNI|nr:MULTISPECIES: hypothetical protein [Streptomyces]MCX5448700.1 hypothetical protein [Streptomyces libani]WAT97135.1 hypothetical protein STRLI_003035 [Streptomyces libani subsp. libani]WAU05073.1 hypothetical protein STRNI_003403 [Streptomyces nigrescens]WDT57118.1 hypothetical protein NUT86_25425 [Streptomyces sp. G7(2002)]GFE22585.1 hypothetical protein Sliba_30380 [Streptomyces libani subsp. libani]
MSYPNQNPYGPPPGQQPQQPHYGYPQQPQPPSPYGPYPGGGGMPGMQMQYPTVMPGGVKAARVMLFVLSGLNLIGLVLAVMGLGGVSKASHEATLDTAADNITAMNVGKGLLIAVIVIIVVFTATAITLALQFANGGSGVRAGTIVFGVANIMLSLFTFPIGLVHTVLGILVLVFVAKDEGNAWFSRPRY